MAKLLLLGAVEADKWVEEKRMSGWVMQEEKIKSLSKLLISISRPAKAEASQINQSNKICQKKC